MAIRNGVRLQPLARWAHDGLAGVRRRPLEHGHRRDGRGGYPVGSLPDRVEHRPASAPLAFSTDWPERLRALERIRHGESGALQEEHGSDNLFHIV